MTPAAERRHRALLLLAWLVAALAYMLASRGPIARWTFADPDDAMRLLEVRDWLAGQSWFDVAQYRMNPPTGAPMHWSRLVDVPIAALILPLRPLLGAHAGETAALVAVPLLTLGAAMAASASLARRLISPAAGLVAAALAPLTTAAIQQMRPMRIDHHGWQVVLCVLIARALLIRDARRAGALAGALAGLWLTISLEGLPFVAAAGALAALGWLLDPAAGRARLEAFAPALAGSAFALFAATRAGAAWTTPACDAASPVHLAVVAVAALGAPLATRLADSLRARLLALALLGGACGAAFALVGPRCLSAFSALDPLVTRYWYRNVLEGLPLWDQSFGVCAAAIGFPLVALAGTAWRLARLEGEPRRDWAAYAFLLAAAALATLFVQRSGAMANMLALPGAIAPMAAGFSRAQRLRRALPRVLASAGAVVALMPTTPGLAAALVAGGGSAPAHPARECATSADYATAAALPPSILFTDIDIGPGILLMTRHDVIASSHHRNAAGIHDVLAAFLGSEPRAHAIVRRHRARYIVVCADLNEMAVYRRVAPRGFWAQLARGRTPGWLAPAPIPGSALSVWKVVG